MSKIPPDHKCRLCSFILTRSISATFSLRLYSSHRIRKCPKFRRVARVVFVNLFLPAPSLPPSPCGRPAPAEWRQPARPPSPAESIGHCHIVIVIVHWHCHFHCHCHWHCHWKLALSLAIANCQLSFSLALDIVTCHCQLSFHSHCQLSIVNCHCHCHSHCQLSLSIVIGKILYLCENVQERFIITDSPHSKHCPS